MTTEFNKRVYVPNKGPHDYTSAWDFGELVFCTEGNVNRKDLRTMHSQLSLALEDADEEDYILMSGLTSLCIVACSLFVKKFGRLNLLMFDPDEQKYLERSLVF